MIRYFACALELPTGQPNMIHFTFQLNWRDVVRSFVRAAYTHFKTLQADRIRMNSADCNSIFSIPRYAMISSQMAGKQYGYNWTKRNSFRINWPIAHITIHQFVWKQWNSRNFDRHHEWVSAVSTSIEWLKKLSSDYYDTRSQHAWLGTLTPWQWKPTRFFSLSRHTNFLSNEIINVKKMPKNGNYAHHASSTAAYVPTNSLLVTPKQYITLHYNLVHAFNQTKWNKKESATHHHYHHLKKKWLRGIPRLI